MGINHCPGRGRIRFLLLGSMQFENQIEGFLIQAAKILASSGNFDKITL
jgi:hypothetical protein